MKKPALFETHEEFVGRHEALQGLPDDVKTDAGSFFGKLAARKYAPENMPSDGNLRDEGLALLERIHRA